MNLLFLICTLSGLSASATDGQIKGKVVDSKTHEPLIGVSVVLMDNPAAGAVTDLNGDFVLTADDMQDVLKVMYLGYETCEVSLSAVTEPLTIELKEDNFKLDEVVVTGQGAAISRRRLSSNVATVSGDEIGRMPQGRIDQMLQNALPNVQITLSNGQPGTTSLVKSRGLSSAYSSSTPVIYVDGVRVDNMNTGAALNNPLDGNSAMSGSIGDIPMENIERIEYVTGGAATTLYGSDAANGVIQIFTKKGGEGRLNISFEAQLGADEASSQFYYFKRTKDLLHKTGFYQKYRVSMDGGGEKYGFSLGFSMSDDTGTLIHNANKDRKYDLRFGSRVTIARWLEYQNSFGMTVQDFSRSRNGNEGGYTGLWFTEGSAAANFTYTDADGNTVGYNPDIDAAGEYEYARMKAFVDKAEALQDNRESVRRFQTSHSLVFTPVMNLMFKGTIGLDYRMNTNKLITTNEYLIHTQQKPEGTSDAGSINNFDRKYMGITFDLNGQYKFRHNGWLSSVTTAGFQYFSTYDHQSVYSGTNVRDGAQIMTGAGIQTADEWLSFLYNYGVFVQENIGFLDRYYIDLGLRTDHNTAFGDNVGWQMYPKVGFSYQMTDEKFMRRAVDSGILSSLKIFANYGVAGSYPPAFAYQKTIDINSFLGQQAASFGQYGNDDLGPEKKHSYEAGFNAVLFGRFLNLGFTYYYALTKGALFRVPSLPSSGQEASYLKNVGEIENKGIEITAAFQIVDTRDWNVRLNTSFNTNSNKVLSSGGTVPFSIGGFSSRTVQTVVEEGKPVGFIRGSKAVLNPDGTLKEVLQLQDLGSTLPKFYGNFSLSVVYRDLSFFLSGDYQAGAYVHSFDRQFRFAKGLKDPAIPEQALEGLSQAQSWLDFTNFFVEKADFLKIRNIGVNYTFRPGKVLKNVTVGFNVYNPFSFTASSVDPEASLSGALSQGAVATSGINYSTYSTPRQYIGTVRIGF